MPNYTLEDVYNPTAASIIKIFFDATFLLDLIMLPFILYAIIKSKKMASFRWYLVNSILWNTLLELLLFVGSPIPLGVYPVILITSMFEHIVDLNIMYTILEFGAFCILNWVLGLMMSIGYRLIHLLNLTTYMPFLEFINKPWALKVAIGLFQVPILAFIYLGFEIFLRRRFVLNENIQYLLTEAPFLEDLLRNRKVLGRSL
jgi:hypothetical protein